MSKNILVGQSGGPTAVINASLYGIIKEAAAQSDKIGHVYGMINGIEGFLSGHVMDLSEELSDEDLELYALHRLPILVHAVTSSRKTWTLLYITCFLKNLNS